MASSINLRNKAFIKQCRISAEKLRKKGLSPTPEQIASHALNQPAPCYFVDFYRATGILKHNHKKPDKYISSQLWADMERDLGTIRKKWPCSKTNELILALCTGRAGNPRFYLTMRQATQLAALSI